MRHVFKSAFWTLSGVGTARAERLSSVKTIGAGNTPFWSLQSPSEWLYHTFLCSCLKKGTEDTCRKAELGLPAVHELVHITGLEYGR